MCAYESDIHHFIPKQHQCDQSVSVSFYVKDNSVSSNIISSTERLLDVGKAVPFGFLNFFIPLLKCCFLILTLTIVESKSLFGNNPHFTGSLQI